MYLLLDRSLHDGFHFEKFGHFVGGFGPSVFGIHFGEILFVNTAFAPGVFPGFLGGVGENRREKFNQSIEDLTHDPNTRLAALGTLRIAVEAVLGDVDVVGAQIGRSELTHR